MGAGQAPRYSLARPCGHVHGVRWRPGAGERALSMALAPSFNYGMGRMGGVLGFMAGQ